MKNKRIQPVNNRLYTVRINIFLTNMVYILESSKKNNVALLADLRTMYHIMNDIGDFFGKLCESIIFSRVLLNGIFKINIYSVCMMSFYSKELFQDPFSL